MQKPMFCGLPKNTSSAEITPMMQPATMIHNFSFFRDIVTLLFSLERRDCAAPNFYFKYI